MHLIPRATLWRWLRYVAGGGLNTALTWAIYWVLTHYLAYQAAYAIAYVLGIAFSYAINARLVFKRSMSWLGLGAFGLMYCVLYLTSAWLLGVFVEVVQVNVIWAPLVVTVCMVPLSYLLSAWVLARVTTVQ